MHLSNHQSNGIIGHIILRHLKILMAVSFGAAIVGLGTSYFVPKYYESSFSFLTLSSNTYDSYQLLSSNVSNNNKSLNGDFGGREDVSKVSSIFQSRSFKEEVINSLGLIKYYGVNEDPRPNISAESILNQNIKMIINREDGLVSVKVYDKDSKRSYLIAKKIIEVLEQRLLGDIQEKNKGILEVMESNIRKKKAYLDSLTTRLRTLRFQYKILNSETQSDYLVKNLLYKRKVGNSENPDVLAYMAGIEEVNLLEMLLKEESTAFGFEQSQYLNLKNTYMSPLKSISITEDLVLPETPSKPNSYLIVFGFIVCAFIATVLFLILRHIYQNKEV